MLTIQGLVTEYPNERGEVVKAAGQLSRDKRGAIIAIQREVGLMEYVESGKRLQAEVSAELLATIFAPYTPLHDGAVIIDGNNIVAATNGTNRLLTIV